MFCATMLGAAERLPVPQTGKSTRNWQALPRLRRTGPAAWPQLRKESESAARALLKW